MTATINQQSTEFGPEGDPYFVDYLKQPFAVGDHTPVTDAIEIAQQPHQLSAEEKRVFLQRMVPLMRAAVEPKTENYTATDPNLKLKALKLEFSNPPTEVPVQPEAEKPIDDHTELFSEF